MPGSGPVDEANRSGELNVRRLLLGFGAVTLVAAGHAAHDVANGIGAERPVLSSGAIVAECAALSLGHHWLTRRSAPRWVTLAAGLLLCSAFGLLIIQLHPEEPLPSLAGVGAGLVVGLAVGGLWLLVLRLPLVLERSRLHALEAEGLRREAELARLRVHLHPHFLLNTLNAVAGLVTEDAAAARRLLAALGDLVRDALSTGDEARPFSEDLAWLRRYAEILEARHRGRLTFRWEIAPDTLAVLVPRLLLQPLVENAVKHGALRRPGGGSVLTRSERTAAGQVRFIVEDDGPGLGAAPGEGLGLDLVRRRVALLCPGGSLLLSSSETGTRAEVSLPVTREAPR